MSAVTQCIDIDSNFIDAANAIFSCYIPEQTECFVTSSYWYKNSPVMIHLLLASAAKILQQNGFSVNPEQWYLDIHSFSASKTLQEHPLTWHTDDEANLIGCQVHTLILYLEKDDRITGGNLIVKINNCDRTVIVQSKSIVLMRGDVIHVPEDISGEGLRRSMVFQFQRLDL